MNATGTNYQRTQMEKVERTLALLLSQTLRPGFYGAVRLEFNIHDGVVHHLRRTIEQVEK